MAAVAKHSTMAGGSLTVADLPSNQLTPNFFNSIFNDGMNPFDEYFGNSTAGGLSLATSTLRKEHQMAASVFDKPKLIKDDTLPTIHTKLDQTLTPEQSPKSLTVADGSLPSVLSASRSPSPFTFSIATAFPDSPVSSITPITSPEELTPTGTLTREHAKSLPFVSSTVQGTRKSLSMAGATKSAVHKRSMSLPQSWSSTDPMFHLMSDNLAQNEVAVPSRKQEGQAKASSRVRTRLSDAPVPHLVSRMDGIFVTESISSSDIKTEPLSPTTSTSFHTIDSASAAAGRKRKRSTTDCEDDDEDSSKLNESEKRARFLERNRIAASKCRKKKKIMNQRLEEKSRLLIQQNRFLSATVSKLRSDVLRLKQMVLTHHGCGNAPIEQYLHQESEKYLAADTDDSAKKLKRGAKIAGTNGAIKPEDLKPPSWLNEFRSFQEVESEALKRSNHLLDFDDDDFQKLLLGDQLTLLDEDFVTSPTGFE
ncbi:hypothetical protein Dda_2673 [Drechslerella dactyloides]|uniref:BZIP domain-containing protein n=1 Tax=Drechslerella dactyloides TaxID=74499 RepID=A0AAD6J1G5_DREDA|nr:hypothetical protein Dda_2673 [Drechslerella dactyloides]